MAKQLAGKTPPRSPLVSGGDYLAVVVDWRAAQAMPTWAGKYPEEMKKNYIRIPSTPHRHVNTDMSVNLCFDSILVF